MNQITAQTAAAYMAYYDTQTARIWRAGSMPEPDQRTCEACGTEFDLDAGGRNCDTYGATCDDCPTVYCHSDCCLPSWATDRD